MTGSRCARRILSRLRAGGKLMMLCGVVTIDCGKKRGIIAQPPTCRVCERGSGGAALESPESLSVKWRAVKLRAVSPSARGLHIRERSRRLSGSVAWASILQSGSRRVRSVQVREFVPQTTAAPPPPERLAALTEKGGTTCPAPSS